MLLRGENELKQSDEYSITSVNILWQELALPYQFQNYLYYNNQFCIYLIYQWGAVQHPWFHCIHGVCLCVAEVLPHCTFEHDFQES